MALPVPNIWAGTSVTRCDRIPGEYRNKKPRCSLAQMAPGACEADHAKRARRRVEYSLPSRRSENDWRAAIAIETLRPIAATSRENTHAPGSTSRAKPGGRHLKAFSDQVPGNGSAEFRFRRSCVSSRNGTEGTHPTSTTSGSGPEFVVAIRRRSRGGLRSNSRAEDRQSCSRGNPAGVPARRQAKPGDRRH
jgi:hypothetical protein